MRGAWARLAVLAAVALTSCGQQSVLDRQLAGARAAAAEELARLEEMPPGLRVLPNGRWAVQADGGGAAAGGPGPEFRLEADTLLVPVGDGSFHARVQGVQRRGGVPQVAASPGGVVAAAVTRGRLRPGVSVAAVRVRDGYTRTAGSWSMPADLGLLAVERLRPSPDGKRIACQLVELRSREEGGFDEASRRGVVLASFANLPPLDLGPGVRGPMRWSPDGASLYFLRSEEDGGATLYRQRFVGLEEPAAGPSPATAKARGEAGAAAVEPPPDASAAPVEPSTAAPAAPVKPSTAAPPVDRPARTSPPPVDPAKLVEQIVLLSSQERADRLGAAQTLGTMADPMAVGPLVTAMRSGDAELCRVADRSLRTFFPDTAVAPLQGADADECRSVAADWLDWWMDHPKALDRK